MSVAEEAKEEAKKGKVVVITSRSNVGKVLVKNPEDSRRVVVVVSD